MFTLVVMAAGVGSRYGGVKQLASVGPNGEAFLDFTIADAVTAGASKVVVIVRTAIEQDVRRHVETRLNSSDMSDLDVVYVRQDEYGPKRAKPWGTAHAALAAASEISGPFMICNADDYYGSSACSALASALQQSGNQSADCDDAGGGSEVDSGLVGDVADGIGSTAEDDIASVGEALLCGYRLGFTLPRIGSVSRGVCQVNGNRLLGIVEHHGVTRRSDGTIVSSAPKAVLQEDMVVSMNLWVFPYVMLDWVSDGFDRFLADHGSDLEAEFILPEVVASKMAEGLLTVRVIGTDDRWTGITNPEDLQVARKMLAHSSLS